MSYLVSISYTEYTLMSTFVYTTFFTLLEWLLPLRINTQWLQHLFTLLFHITGMVITTQNVSLLYYND